MPDWEALNPAPDLRFPFKTELPKGWLIPKGALLWGLLQSQLSLLPASILFTYPGRKQSSLVEGRGGEMLINCTFPDLKMPGKKPQIPFPRQILYLVSPPPAPHASSLSLASTSPTFSCSLLHQLGPSPPWTRRRAFRVELARARPCAPLPAPSARARARNPHTLVHAPPPPPPAER